MKADDDNNLSLKVIYFLDYLQLKVIKRKKKNNDAKKVSQTVRLFIFL
jgi:hypothetical protein